MFTKKSQYVERELCDWLWFLPPVQITHYCLFLWLTRTLDMTLMTVDVTKAIATERKDKMHSFTEVKHFSVRNWNIKLTRTLESTVNSSTSQYFVRSRFKWKYRLFQRQICSSIAYFWVVENKISRSISVMCVYRGQKKCKIRQLEKSKASTRILFIYLIAKMQNQLIFDLFFFCYNHRNLQPIEQSASTHQTVSSCKNCLEPFLHE